MAVVLFGSWRRSATRCAALVDGDTGEYAGRAWSFKNFGVLFFVKKSSGQRGPEHEHNCTRKRRAGGYGTVGGTYRSTVGVE